MVAKKSTKKNSKTPVKATKAASEKAAIMVEAVEEEVVVVKPKKAKTLLKLTMPNVPHTKKVVKTLVQNLDSMAPSVEPEGISIDDIPDASNLVESGNGAENQHNMRGMPKSGRNWKVVETARHSNQARQGVMANQSKSYSQHTAARDKKRQIKALEQEMKDARIEKIAEKKQKKEDQEKRRLANQYKSSSTQNINPEKLKSMSKKQLRLVKKTRMNNRTGQLELVNAY